LFYGLTGGAFTPGRIGEYAGRGLILNDKSFITVSAATMIEKFFVLFNEIIFGTAALAAFMILKNPEMNPQILYGFSFLICFIIFCYKFKNRLLSSVINICSRIKLLNRYPELIKTILTIDKKYIRRMMIITTLYFIIYTLQFVLAAASFTTHFDFINLFWAAVLIMFSKTALGFFSFGELGVREGAAVYIFTLFGFSGSAGFNAGILIFLINIILPALAGMFLSFTDSRNA